MIRVAIKKALGDFRLDVDFAAPGGVTAVFGRSGSGKTSLIRAIAGLLQPDSGQIEIAGTMLFGTGVDLAVNRRRIGYVFQDVRLFPHLTVAQNLTYGGAHDMARVIDILGLGPLLDRRPRRLSGGEKQRVALGRALLCNPRILLMDEPLSALDAPRKAEIMPYLERLRDDLAVPMIYVSHDMSEVARLATTLVVLEAGRVVQAGPVADVLSDPGLLPLIGVRAAGAVLHGRITGHDPGDGLTQVAFSGGPLVLPGDLGVVGQGLRLRIPAQDVILARTSPEGISALNVWSVRIARIEHGQGPGVAVVLQAGEDRILARITRRSARALELAAGQDIFAILKATAVAAQDIGRETF